MPGLDRHRRSPDRPATSHRSAAGAAAPATVVADARSKGLVGALRASVGLANNRADVDRLLSVLGTS